MSSSILREQQLADNIVGAVPGLPREAIMDTVPRSSLMATKKIVNLVPISSNSVGPSQTLQFLIPQRNLGKAHSFYLKFKLSLAGGQSKLFAFSGSMQSAAALINSISVQAGGTVIEACQNYHIWHNNVLNWTQKRDQLAIECATSGTALPTRYSTNIDMDATSSIPSNAELSPFNAYAASQQQTCNADATGTYNEFFSIPIGMGFFNPKESQFLPLFQFNGGVLLTIQTNPISKAFFATNTTVGSDPATTTAAAISDYVMSDFELCYTEIQPSSEYVDAVRSGLNNGKLIKIEAQSYLNYQIACGDNIRQTLNLNCQSLSASFWGRVEQSDALHTSKFFVKQSGITDANSSAIRYEMYYDNVLLFQSPNQLNYDTVVLRQLQEALCSSITDHAVVPFVNGIGVNSGSNTSSNTNLKLAGNLANQAWLYGLSNKLFASNSTSMDGTPVGTVQIQFQTTGDSITNLWYFYFVYDYMYMVDANGSVSKIM
jgi:hypothetical protein